jgi:signal transduction histidine kinase
MNLPLKILLANCAIVLLALAALHLNRFLALAVIGLLSWLIATHIARPLAALSRALQRFGDGDLSLRLNSQRHDEIGQLGRDFDRMAGRLQHLITLDRQLLQDISHELRSPLARLSLAAQLTKQLADRDPATQQIEKEIHRLDALIGHLVSSTRLEADTPQLLPLKPLLHDIISDCRTEAAAKGCRIVKRLDPAPVIELNPELLRRAIENVLRNAVRHAPESSTIDVELLEDDRQVEIAIRDRGPGVPTQSLNRIFQPFFQVEEARSNGLGLGLAIAQRAIHHHHGRITAENASPGLRVTITLPFHN